MNKNRSLSFFLIESIYINNKDIKLEKNEESKIKIATTKKQQKYKLEENKIIDIVEKAFENKVKSINFNFMLNTALDDQKEDNNRREDELLVWTYSIRMDNIKELTNEEFDNKQRLMKKDISKFNKNILIMVK